MQDAHHIRDNLEKAIECLEEEEYDEVNELLCASINILDRYYPAYEDPNHYERVMMGVGVEHPSDEDELDDLEYNQ